MYTFLYNCFFIPLAVCASAAVPIVVCYVTNPESTRKAVFNASWKMTKKYFEIKDYFEDIYDKFMYTENGYDADDEGGDSDSETTDNCVIKNLIFIDQNNNKYINSIETYKNIKKYDCTLIFVNESNNNENKYKRIENLSETSVNAEIKKYNKLPFIQVEYVDNTNDNRISIHKQLESFYIEDNKLLDETFLKWFMMNFYNTKISDTYTIQCFDKDVNMFELSKNDQLTLINSDKNLYKIERNGAIEKLNVKVEKEIKENGKIIIENVDLNKNIKSNNSKSENLINFSDQESDGSSSS